MVRLACIVEGHGDVESVPIIIRRIADAVRLDIPLEIPRPIRIPRSKLIKEGELENAVELAVRQTRGDGGISVLIDADDDCAKDLGALLRNRCLHVRPGLLLSVVLATKEIESWFIAAAESIRGCCGLQQHLSAPPDVEEIRGAKEWLTQHMEADRVYSPTLDQPALASVFDIELAQRSKSFSKFRRDVERILLQSAQLFQARLR